MKCRLLPACLYIALAFTTMKAAAEETGPFFWQHYDNRNGLSNSAINHIYKDASNLLWIATWDGLNMYDGNTFHVFNYSKENDSKSIGSNVIRQVTGDKRGNIWITTIEGISRYEKRSGKFYNYFYQHNQQGKVSEQEFALVTDTAGNVYCLDQKTGFNWYDTATDTFRNIATHLQKRPVSKLLFDAMNRLWVLDAYGGIAIYSLSGDHRYTPVQSIQTAAPATNLFRVGQELFFTIAGDKLYRYSYSNRAAEWITDLPHTLTAIICYKQHYFLAWATKGYGVYDLQMKPTDWLQQETKQLQDIRITTWAIGSEDILWYGTDGNGIIKVYPKTKSFGTIGTADNGLAYNRAVRSFCEVNGDLWIGTKGSGIMNVQQFWKGNRVPQSYFSYPASLDNNSVYALTKGSDQLVYIGTDGKGIGVYDLIAKKFFKWSDMQGSNVLPEFGSVYAIWQDADQSLWLGTSGYGLIHLKIKRNGPAQLSVAFLQRYMYNNSNTGPANDIIYALADEGNDQLWIGCRYGGLNLFDKRTRLFKTYKAFTSDSSLSNNDVLSLYKDNRNRLWIGTSYGLNRIDVQQAMSGTPIFQKFTTTNGLPNNTIHAITEDSTGQIWVSTNKGLARLEASGDQIAYYQQGDGLQSNEFSDGAVWKDGEGRLFFGGTYGFNQFFPQDIRSTGWKPGLLLSGMLFGGKETDQSGYQVLDRTANKPFHATISRKDNFFELDVKAISFLNAEKCEYAWYLEGYDKTWHYSGTNGKINYSNIAPGPYTLHIKWSNGEGGWSKEIALLHLTVMQYWWLRWYAILGYLLAAAWIFYIVYSYRKNKQQIRHELEMEHRLREKDEAMHQSRIGFFTNIAHELQTPLTLIMGSAERFIDKANPGKELQEKPYFLSLIHQQASRLTYLVQQLLEFRKGEAGFSRNQYSFMDISELLQNLAEPFMPLSEKNRMEYETNITPGIIGWMDKDKLEKIIFNLLSNAFKHADKNEQVLFSATENTHTKELEIAVVNSCTGLTPDIVEQLFDQFYVNRTTSSNTDKFGTGIGLTFTRQLVTLLNGRITVCNDNDRITFKVFLPMEAEEMESRSPMEVPAVSDQPSLLYRSITNHPEPGNALTAAENNKQAILETLQPGHHKKSILVVEDDADIRYLVKDIFKNDYTIHEAADGQKALEQMEIIMPDLVICDVMMPNMNGLDFCSSVKNAPATCHIPIIMLSARGGEDHRMEGYEVGADAYMAKPFHATYLKLRVRKMLEYRQKLVEVFKREDTVHELEAADMPGDDKQFLTKLIQVIEENMAETALNALFLEKSFSLSKMQLYRKLKTLTGMTPSEFIRLTRLRQAADLLVSTQLSVMEVFYRTGFNNQSYFFREFKKRYHCAPGEYREKRGVL